MLTADPGDTVPGGEVGGGHRVPHHPPAAGRVVLPGPSQELEHAGQCGIYTERWGGERAIRSV